MGETLGCGQRSDKPEQIISTAARTNLQERCVNAKGFFDTTKPLLFAEPVWRNPWAPIHQKDKTFLFTYEGDRIRRGSSETP